VDPATQSISLCLSNGVVTMNYVATFSVYIQKLPCWGPCLVQALCACRYSGIMSGVHAHVCVVAKWLLVRIVPEDVMCPSVIICVMSR
jgi:hypothetical protein